MKLGKRYMGCTSSTLVFNDNGEKSACLLVSVIKMAHRQTDRQTRERMHAIAKMTIIIIEIVINIYHLYYTDIISECKLWTRRYNFMKDSFHQATN